jgi:hypothetical protein
VDVFLNPSSASDGKGRLGLMAARSAVNMSDFRIRKSSGAGGDPTMSSESCERRIFEGPNTAEPESRISSKVVTTIGNGGRALSLIHVATRSEDRADASRKAPLDKLSSIQRKERKKKKLPGREGQCAVRANAVPFFPCYLLDSLTPL